MTNSTKDQTATPHNQSDKGQAKANESGKPVNSGDAPAGSKPTSTAR